jgi:uncharacterized protein (TIGR02265 family)
MADLEGFIAPPWDAPIDVEAYVACAPRRATVKGMFFRSVLEATRAHAAALEAERYTAFKDYPLTDYIRLLDRCAGAAFRTVPRREGLRRLGWEAFPTFASSVVGKVILSLSTDDFQLALRSVSKVYGVIGNVGGATAEVLSDGRALVALRSIQTFADSYHVGVFEGAMKSFGVEGKVQVRSHKLEDHDLLLEWQPRAP